MNNIDNAIASLRNGQFVLLHDDKNRENEIDMIVSAEFVCPSHIATMRKDAGGLLCVAIDNRIASSLGLVYMHDILKSMSSLNPIFDKLTAGVSPYGDKPSFSISINHRETYTGITDSDRALTISHMATISKNIQPDKLINDFTNTFRSPGHVPILIASPGLLSERTGHTELSIYLAKLAGIIPVVAICEMLDSSSFKSLSLDNALEYSKQYNIPLINSNELKKLYVMVD